MPPNNTFDLAALAEAGRVVQIDGAGPDDSFDEELVARHDSQASSTHEAEYSDAERNIDVEAESGDQKNSIAFGWANHVELESGNECRVSIHRDEGEEPDKTFSSPHIRHYIRTRSSMLVDDNKETEVDEERLAQAVRDAGDNAFGVLGVEVWVLDQDDGLLKRPNGGWWRSPYLDESEDLERLENKFHPRHAPADPTMPGVGLAGTLWFESTGVRRMRRQSSVGRSLVSLGGSVSHIEEKQGLDNTGVHGGESHKARVIRWRDVKSLLADPDTAKGERLGLMLNAGFGLAAGVTFELGGHKGMVVYLAREFADQDHLLSTENQVYMLRASELIGAVVASTDARRAAVVYRRGVSASACRKVRNSLRNSESSNIRRFKSDPNSSSVKEQQETPKWVHMKEKVMRKSTTWLEKCKGGDLQAPPAMTFRQSAWTWIGCFVGLLILSTMNEYAQSLSNDEYLLLIGPFGALMTLQYGLTAAPASQPRNVILGQAVAGAVSLSFTYIPESILSTWLRRAVGPAFSIATMLKLGIPHPPAGAHSVIYASGKYGWMFYFLVVFASIISVIPATLVNNMSEKRQYPTYWVKKHNFPLRLPKRRQMEKEDATQR